jgi:hypothetical protein
LLRSRCVSSWRGSSALSKYFGVRPGPHGGALSAIARARLSQRQRLDHVAARKRDRGHLALAPHADGQPPGQGVGDAHAHAVQAAREAVRAARALVELAAGMKAGVDDLQHRHLLLRVQAERNASAVVLDADGAVRMNRQRDALAEAGQGFVSRVVDHFLDDVQRAFGAGVHARPLLHGL